MSEYVDFHYMPLEGKITGKQVLKQTEDAINDLGNHLYDLDIDEGRIDEAVEKSEQAIETAESALSAVTTDRSVWKNTIADMKATNIEVGVTAATRGKTLYNDGDGAFYVVRQEKSGDVEGEDTVFLDNGNVAERLKQFNFIAKGNNIIYVESVASLREADAVIGNVYGTTGYYSANDGGASIYTIRAKDVADVDDGGSIIFLDNGNVAELITDGIVNVKQFGAYGDGTHDDTNAINTAYQNSKYNLYIPPGTYKGNFDFTMSCKNVYGADRHSTILIPADSAKPVVTWFGNVHQVDGMDAILSNLCIDCNATGATGLQIGYSDYTYGDVGYGWIHDIDVKSGLPSANISGVGILMNRGTDITIERVYVSYFDIGIQLIGGSSNQLNSFIACRFRFNRIGAELRAGQLIRWDNCVFEANKQYGTTIQRLTTNGPSRNIFKECWWEKNGWGSHTAKDQTYTSIYIDRYYTLTDDVPTDLLFEKCVIASHTQGDSLGDAPDAFNVSLVRGRNIIFDNCAFDSVGNVMNDYRFYFIKYNKPHAILKQCGTLDQVPNETLYASFPALVRQNNIITGFEYVYNYNGVEYSNAIFNVFTPIVFGKSTEGTATYQRQVGRYTKIGNIVHFFISLKWTNYTGTGIMAVKGLPFDQNVDIAVPITFRGTLAGVTTGNMVCPMLSSNSINLYQKADDKSADTAVTTGDGDITLCGTYMAQ